MPSPGTIHFPCGNAGCPEVLHADVQHGGLLAKCPRCGQISTIPGHPNRGDADADGPRFPHTGLRAARLFLILSVGLLAILAAVRWSDDSRSLRRASATSPNAAHTLALASSDDPSSILQAELLRAHAADRSDDALGAKYAALNQIHFGGALPSVAVVWEPRLREIGPLIAPDVVVKGLTDGHVILVNPQVPIDSDELDGVLGHEAVHVSMFQQGRRDQAHGPAFQEALERLMADGAFKGLPATPDEKSRLRRIVDSESRGLDAEHQRLAESRTALDDEQSRFDRDVRDFNARMEAANAAQAGWPGPSERASLRDRGDALQVRIDAYNQDVRALTRTIDRHNDTVNRYRLMCLYPDGLDGDAAAVRAKAAAGLALGPTVNLK